MRLASRPWLVLTTRTGCAIEPQLIASADIYVADSLAQTRRLGELHHAINAGVVDENARFAELGQIIAGEIAGRTSADQITIADLT